MDTERSWWKADGNLALYSFTEDFGRLDVKRGLLCTYGTAFANRGLCLVCDVLLPFPEARDTPATVPPQPDESVLDPCGSRDRAGPVHLSHADMLQRKHEAVQTIVRFGKHYRQSTMARPGESTLNIEPPEGPFGAMNVRYACGSSLCGLRNFLPIITVALLVGRPWLRLAL